MLKLDIENKQTGFDKAFETTLSGLGDTGNKTGFALYQHYRDFFLSVFTDPVKSEAFIANDVYSAAIGDFTLCDKAYIDNFALSMTLKLKAPEAYSHYIKTIDTYVRPLPRNEGLNHFYQEIGGYLALMLKEHEALSERQALRLAAYLVGYSESMVEKRYREKKKNLKGKRLPQPHLMALLALYWALLKRNRDLSALKPLKKHSRSIDELLKAKRAYSAFTLKTVKRYYPALNDYLAAQPRSILHTAKNDFGIDFALFEKPITAPSPFAMFVFLCCAFALEYMPGVLQAVEKQFTVTAPTA